jgi:SAM-dependent methyltransferase
MSKSDEVAYLGNLSAVGVAFAEGRPFTDPKCGSDLADFGTLMTLLPPPPARLLDLGCGTGWTSVLFARAGYQVVGADIAPDMLAVAARARDHLGLDNLSLVVADYEGLPFRGEFDAIVFFDSLHHAADERLALSRACRALRPGGVCVTREPGEGHSRTPEAVAAVRAFGVTEKDMPPERIMSLGRLVGFARAEFFPRPLDLLHLVTRPTSPPGGRGVKAALGRLAAWIVGRWWGAGCRLFASPTAEVTCYRNLAAHLRDAHRVAGLVRLIK